MPSPARTASALAVAAFAVAGLAAATPTKPAKTADITGAWAFETHVYGPHCQLSGSMMIRPSGAGFSCVFTAQERCQDITVKAQETCEAKRDGEAMTIIAHVNRVAPQVGYEPDNFELTIQSGSYMKGMLRSFHSAPVDFFRGDAPVS